MRVMDAAAARDIPLVVVQHTFPQPDKPFFQRGTPQWELHPEVRGRPHDLLIEKNCPGSFTGTELESWLRQQGIDTVVISGYMTHMCCDTTARQAVHRGFTVEFLSDATGFCPSIIRRGRSVPRNYSAPFCVRNRCCSARSSARTRGAGALRNRASGLSLALHVPREAGRSLPHCHHPHASGKPGQCLWVGQRRSGHPAEQPAAADAFQRPLMPRSHSQARLSAALDAILPSKGPGQGGER